MVCLSLSIKDTEESYLMRPEEFIRGIPLKGLGVNDKSVEEGLTLLGMRGCDCDLIKRPVLVCILR